MRGPSPSPVAAAEGQQPVQTDGPDDVLTAINVAKITNWNEPPATEFRSASVHRGFTLSEDDDIKMAGNGAGWEHILLITWNFFFLWPV